MQHRIFYTIRQYLYHFHLFSPTGVLSRGPSQPPGGNSAASRFTGFPGAVRTWKAGKIIHRLSTANPQFSQQCARSYPQHSTGYSHAIHRNYTALSTGMQKKHLKATIRKSFCFMDFLMVLPGFQVFQVFQQQKRGFSRRSPGASPALAPALP